MHYNFLHRSEFLPHAVVYRGAQAVALAASPLPELASLPVESRLGLLPLQDYILRAPVNGIIVLRRGRIVFERYPRMRPFDRHLLMSVTKVMVSTALALLAERGLLDCQQPVDHYLPALQRSEWRHTPVQDILDMASGIDAPEEQQGFTNPAHPYYQFEASLGWLPRTERTLDSTYQVVTTLARKEPPGLRFEYTSVNTFVLGWLAETLSGLPLHEVLASMIWGRAGADSDALLAVSTSGAPAAHAGLCATLRDVARFGLLFTPTARARGPDAAIGEAHLAKIRAGGRPELFLRGPSGPPIIAALHGETPRHNVDQWDYVFEDGDFFKGGYGGQGLYISPARDLVVAYFGTPFDEQMETHELQWITRQVVKSGVV